MPIGPEQYLQPDVLRQIERLDLRAKFIVEGFLSGLHRSPYHGFSVEFSEHRKYTPGDEPRLIDWNAYAKTDRYFVKKFQAETNVEAYLLVDCSGSMAYASADRMSKMEYAICLAAALGHLSVRQQDPLGLFVFDEKIRRALPPRASRAHLNNMLTVLARTRPHGKTQLGQCLHRIAHRLSRRSLLILLSDLLTDQADVIDGLQHLRHDGHDLIVFQIMDHAERYFDFDRMADFEDPETHDHIQADPRALRPDYLRRLNAFLEEYRQACLACRAEYVTVDNSMTFDTALREFLIQRQLMA